MIHRSLLRVLPLALLAAACDRSPTDPSRPGTFNVTFLGAPAGAESFSPRAVDAGRVVGVASAADSAWTVQWLDGVFTRIGPATAPGCFSEPVAARGGFTVGQVTCTASGDPSGQPVDAYGWTTGETVPPRLFTEPYTFVAVNRSGTVVGTINPGSQFPQGQRRAFVRTGGSAAVLLPPGASASEAVGVTDDGEVVVNAWYSCLSDEETPPCYLSRPLVWRGGEWVEIRLPSRTNRALALAVGSEGHVAGLAFGEADQTFLHRIGRSGVKALPVIPGTRVLLTGANARGQVIGTGIRPEATARQVSYGIVWGDERQYDLTERLSGLQRWLITAAMGTDDEGRIAGTGLNTEAGLEGAILLTPTNLR